MLAIGIREFLILFLFLFVGYRNIRWRSFPLPPGPSRWPVIGNALMIPSRYVQVFYQQLGKKLESKIVYLEALGQPIIILNDINMARDLLDKRSAVYSNRPVNRMVSEIIGFDVLFGLMPYGDEWRMHRRIFSEHLSEKHLPQLQEKALDFVRKSLLANLVTNPEELHNHVKNTVGGFSTSITYGLPIERRNDPLVLLAEKGFADATSAAAPGKYLVNVVPQLKYLPEWMPGSDFKREAKKIRKQLDRLMEEPYETVVKMMDEGTARPSFVADALEQYRSNPDYDQLAKYVKQTAVQIFGAVFETNIGAIMTFILAMLIHPDVQRKGQKEVDSVIGPDHLPEFSDVPQLTFVSAITKEVLRWNPIAPFGVPHTSSEEDVYKGYYIPKNSIVIANTYAMLHDEAVFPDPEDFKPERFVNEDGSICKDLPDPEVVASFGFGRRICPGAHIGRSILSIVAASFLYLFDISPALDADGRPVIVKPEFTAASIASEPFPFPCKVTPREGKDVKGLLNDFFGTDPI